MPHTHPPVHAGDSLTPHLSRTALLLHAHLQQHGPSSVRSLQRTFGPDVTSLIQELKAHWLIFHAQGDGTRAGRHGALHLTPQGRTFSHAELLAMHAQLQGERGTLAHFQRRLHLSAGDTLAALHALVNTGRASGGITGATVACQVRAMADRQPPSPQSRATAPVPMPSRITPSASPHLPRTFTT